MRCSPTGRQAAPSSQHSIFETVWQSHPSSPAAYQSRQPLCKSACAYASYSHMAASQSSGRTILFRPKPEPKPYTLDADSSAAGPGGRRHQCSAGGAAAAAATTAACNLRRHAAATGGAAAERRPAAAAAAGAAAAGSRVAGPGRGVEPRVARIPARAAAARRARHGGEFMCMFCATSINLPKYGILAASLQDQADQASRLSIGAFVDRRTVRMLQSFEHV